MDVRNSGGFAGSVTTTVEREENRERQQEYHLTLRAPSEESASAEERWDIAFAEKLAAIILKHSDEEGERFSHQLTLEGTRFIELVCTSEHELRHEIARGALTPLKRLLSWKTGRSMQKLWRVGRFYCEEFALKLYCRANNRVLMSLEEKNIPPFNYEILGRPHHFAEELLSWMENLEGPRERWPRLAASQQSLSKESVRVAVNDLGVPILLGLPESIEEAINSCTSFSTLGEGEESLTLPAAREVISRFQTLMDEVSEIEKMERDCLALEGEKELLKEEIAEGEERFRKGLDTLLESHQETREKLSSRIKKADERITALELKQIAEKGELQEQLGNEKARLREALWEIYNLKGRVMAVERDNSLMQGRINALQSRLNNMDGGGCCIA